MKEGQFIFRRYESKYFVPPSEAEKFMDVFEWLQEDLELKELKYDNSINRTVYYFPTNVNGFYPGFGFRYRDYVQEQTDEFNVRNKMNGYYEFKCTDENEGDKRKLRVPSPYLDSFTSDGLLNIISGSSADDGTKQWFREKLLSQRIKTNERVIPIVAVTYCRRHFQRNGNDISLDSKLNFFAVGIRDDGTHMFIKIGNYGGALLEIKEKSEDVVLKWQLYRELVKYNAERFYSKKGHALNLLHHAKLAKTNAELIESELPGQEVESKLDIKDPSIATALLTTLYSTLEPKSNFTGFYVAPDRSTISSQTTIDSYYLQPDSSGLERKMVVCLGSYNYVTESPLSVDGNVYTRLEDKESSKEFSRKQVRQERGDYRLISKTLKTQNSFYVYSQTDRIYKISVDINRKIPFSSKKVFSQLEVKYVGKVAGSDNSSIVDIRSLVIDELSSLNKHIASILIEKGIDYPLGERKVSTLVELPD